MSNRPYKLMKADSESTLLNDAGKKFVPENTIKYRSYKIVKTSKNEMTLNEIMRLDNKPSSRRVYEKALTDLCNSDLITRTKCRCNCSYIYNHK